MIGISFRALSFRFLKNRSGAALIEYSILIGLITSVTITLVIAVGGWVSGVWNTMSAVLNLAT